jgi:hypothetical protein
MKTPIDYLATEFKAITRMDLSDIPALENIQEFVKAIEILIEQNVADDSIARFARGYAAELQDRMFLVYA